MFYEIDKFSGGGINEDEDKKETLIPEVREETGLVVIPESFYYLCKVEEVLTEQNLDAYEAEAGFVLRFVHLNEAIENNSKYCTEDFLMKL